MSGAQHTPGPRLVASRQPPAFEVRDCHNCIDATTVPAFNQRCHGCIDSDDRPNWFPPNGADIEFLSWFPPRAAIAKATGSAAA